MSNRRPLHHVAAIAYVGSVAFDDVPIFHRSIPFAVSVIYLALRIVQSLRGPKYGAVNPGDASQSSARSAGMLLMTLFVVLSGVSAFWTIDFDATVTRTISLAVNLVVALVLAGDLAYVRTPAIAAFALSSAFVALLVIASPASVGDRRTATGDANDVALGLLMGAASCIWLIGRSDGRKRIVYVGAFGVAVWGTVLTGSRTAIIGAGLMLVAAGVHAALRRSIRAAVGIVGVVAGLYIAFLVVPRSLIPPRLLTIQQELATGTLSERRIIWNAIEQHGWSWFGIGSGGTPTYMTSAIGAPSVAHNVWLGVLLELGAIGVAVLGAGLALSLLGARRTPFVPLLVLIVPAVFAGTLSLSLEYRRMLWLVLAFCWALPALKTRDTEIGPSKIWGGASGGEDPVITAPEVRLVQER